MVFGSHSKNWYYLTQCTLSDVEVSKIADCNALLRISHDFELTNAFRRNTELFVIVLYIFQLFFLPAGSCILHKIFRYISSYFTHLFRFQTNCEVVYSTWLKLALLLVNNRYRVVPLLSSSQRSRKGLSLEILFYYCQTLKVAHAQCITPVWRVFSFHYFD